MLAAEIMDTQIGDNRPNNKLIKQNCLESSDELAKLTNRQQIAFDEGEKVPSYMDYGVPHSVFAISSNSAINTGDDRKSIRSSLGGDAETLSQPPLNEPLLGGFALLRAVQLLNFDIYYLGLDSKSNKAAKMSRQGDLEAAASLQQKSINLIQNSKAINPTCGDGYSTTTTALAYYRTFLDELAEYNPLQKYIDRFSLLDAFCKFLKICLSLAAIMIGFDKTITTIILCLSTKIDSPETSNSGMGLFVLILVNLSSMYILFSTVFNGHLLWNLLSQRLFLVSRRFQYKTMLCLLIFVYLEYIINISFINNLYDWDFISNNIQSGSYSVLANLRIIVTEQDEEHYYIDILLTVIQFARGAIRISPYITINYAIICLKEHIHTIRNQHLLTDSLKKRQKLRLVVTNKRKAVTKGGSDGATGRKKRVNFVTNAQGEPTTDLQRRSSNVATTIYNNNRESLANRTSNCNNIGNNISEPPVSKEQQRGQLKRPRASSSSVIGWRPTIPEACLGENVTSIPISFIGSSITSIDNEPDLNRPQQQSLPISQSPMQQQLHRPSLIADSGSAVEREVSFADSDQRSTGTVNARSEDIEKLYLARIRDFDELESYITNLYIFTGRLNRFMSRQGLTVFFIVHNLVISVSVIVPEAVRGGPIIASLVRFLVVLIGIVPFVFGQSLNSQLEQLSKQIDRIIIQQQFIHRRRDNLVRIRELVHDIRVNCGGMLNFNVETGLKYLGVAFASAFFIEQERKFTTINN